MPNNDKGIKNKWDRPKKKKILLDNSTDLSQLGFVTLNDTKSQIIHITLYATNVFIP